MWDQLCLATRPPIPIAGCVRSFQHRSSCASETGSYFKWRNAPGDEDVIHQEVTIPELVCARHEVLKGELCVRNLQNNNLGISLDYQSAVDIKGDYQSAVDVWGLPISRRYQRGLPISRRYLGITNQSTVDIKGDYQSAVDIWGLPIKLPISRRYLGITNQMVGHL